MIRSLVSSCFCPVSFQAPPQTLKVSLGELAEVKVVKGPTAIKSEEGLLASYVYIDFSCRDVGGYVTEAKQLVAGLKIPDGYRIEWSSEYEYMVKTAERLRSSSRSPSSSSSC